MVGDSPGTAAQDQQAVRPSGSAPQLIEWLPELVDELQATDWKDALRYHGVNVCDVLFSPIYEATLRLQRGENRQNQLKQARRPLRKRLQQRVQSAVLRQKVYRASQSVRGANVVLWPRLPTHVRQQVPVAKALQRIGVEIQVVACQPRIAAMLMREGLDVTFTGAEWCQEIAKARSDAERLRPILNNAIEVASPVAGLEQSRVVVAEIRRVLQLQLATAYESVIVSSEILKATGASVVVVGNDVTTEGRASALLARQRGIPVCSLMHGTVAGTMHRVHVVDLLLAFGANDQSSLEQRGVDARKIRVCGAPYLDAKPVQIGKLDQRVSRHLRRHLGSIAGKPVVLALTSGPGGKVSYGHHLTVVEEIVRLSDLRPDAAFVVKLHPKDSPGYYADLAARGSNSNLIVIPNGTAGLPSDIFDWLQGGTLVLTGASMSAREAMLMNVPVISMDFANEIHNVDFIDCGATRHVTDRAQLAASVAELLDGGIPAEQQEAVNQYLANSFHRLDGHAADRCADAIVELAGQAGAGGRLPAHEGHAI